MTSLIEHRSRKAARILDRARRLVADHGLRKVTVSEIADAAGVGKGTVYLYWPSKEDLILGLYAREVLTFLDAVIARVTADPAAVLPRRLAPLLVRAGRESPLAFQITSGDTDLLRPLTEQVGDRDLFDRTQPAALCDAVLPILREHGLTRADRPLADQAYAMHAVLLGFTAAMAEPAFAPHRPAGPAADPDDILADTVARLLDPPAAPGDQAIAEAADETLAVLHRARDAVLAVIARTQTSRQ